MTALGIGQNITARKIEEEQYTKAYEQLAHANPDFINSYRLNITKNICESMTCLEPGYEYLRKHMAAGTVDGLMAESIAIIPDERIADEARRLFTRENLLNSFEEGRRASPSISQSHEGWVVRLDTGTVYMLRILNTGDVEGVTYAENIDTRKGMRGSSRS